MGFLDSLFGGTGPTWPEVARAHISIDYSILGHDHAPENLVTTKGGTSLSAILGQLLSLFSSATMPGAKKEPPIDKLFPTKSFKAPYPWFLNDIKWSVCGPTGKGEDSTGTVQLSIWDPTGQFLPVYTLLSLGTYVLHVYPPQTPNQFTPPNDLFKTGGPALMYLVKSDKCSMTYDQHVGWKYEIVGETIPSSVNVNPRLFTLAEFSYSYEKKSDEPSNLFTVRQYMKSLVDRYNKLAEDNHNAKRSKQPDLADFSENMKLDIDFSTDPGTTAYLDKVCEVHDVDVTHTVKTKEKIDPNHTTQLLSMSLTIEHYARYIFSLSGSKPKVDGLPFTFVLFSAGDRFLEKTQGTEIKVEENAKPTDINVNPIKETQYMVITIAASNDKTKKSRVKFAILSFNQSANGHVSIYKDGQPNITFYSGPPIRTVDRMRLGLQALDFKNIASANKIFKCSVESINLGNLQTILQSTVANDAIEKGNPSGENKKADSDGVLGSAKQNTLLDFGGDEGAFDFVSGVNTPVLMNGIAPMERNVEVGENSKMSIFTAAGVEVVLKMPYTPTLTLTTGSSDGIIDDADVIFQPSAGTTGTALGLAKGISDSTANALYMIPPLYRVQFIMFDTHNINQPFFTKSRFSSDYYVLNKVEHTLGKNGANTVVTLQQIPILSTDKDALDRDLEARSKTVAQTKTNIISAGGIQDKKNALQPTDAANKASDKKNEPQTKPANS